MERFNKILAISRCVSAKKPSNHRNPIYSWHVKSSHNLYIAKIIKIQSKAKQTYASVSKAVVKKEANCFL